MNIEEHAQRTRQRAYNTHLDRALRMCDPWRDDVQLVTSTHEARAVKRGFYRPGFLPRCSFSGDCVAEERGSYRTSVSFVPLIESTNHQSDKVPRRAKGHTVAGPAKRNKVAADHDIIIRRERRNRSSQRGGTPSG